MALMNAAHAVLVYPSPFAMAAAALPLQPVEHAKDCKLRRSSVLNSNCRGGVGSTTSSSQCRYFVFLGEFNLAIDIGPICTFHAQWHPCRGSAALRQHWCLRWLWRWFLWVIHGGAL